MAIFKSVYDAVDAAIASLGLPKGGPPLATAARVIVANDGNLSVATDVNGIPTYSVQEGLTAFAGGGQGSATKITSAIARVTVVASAADSVLLPAAVAGLEVTVINAAANSMNVFPRTGESINALSANTALALPGTGTASKPVTFYCTLAGKWHTLVSA